MFRRNFPCRYWRPNRERNRLPHRELGTPLHEVQGREREHPDRDYFCAFRGGLWPSVGDVTAKAIGGPAPT
jgi:hypothetical protein